MSSPALQATPGRIRVQSSFATLEAMARLAHQTGSVVHVVVVRQPGVVKHARTVAHQAGVDLAVDLLAFSISVRFAPRTTGQHSVRAHLLQTHLAVVPVAHLDSQTEQALQYASTLAPRVLAVHVRDEAAGYGRALEEAWVKHEPTLPGALVVLATPSRDWQHPFVRALQVLRRTNQADQITVVIPPRLRPANRQRRPGLSATNALRLGLLLVPGVVVKEVPPMGESQA